MATHDEARTAIYTALVEIVESAPKYSGTTASSMLRDAAIAFRAVVGGQQPGSVVVESK